MTIRRPLLLPFTPLFWAASRLRAHAYGRLLLPIHHLENPVISVGSLSAGGAGKTPVVLLLADLLTQHGKSVTILTRGYGRVGRAIEQVHSLATEAAAALRFGDEPVLLARRSAAQGTPVFVGANRFLAGKLAESSTPPASPLIHLLDDGFQHRRLARAVDLVLLTLADLDDTLLPAGNLREPLAALRRAHILILREEEAPLLAPIVSRLRRRNPNLLYWQIRRSLQIPLVAPPPQRPFIFSAIARPDNFFAMLVSEGFHPAARKDFPDHHRFLPADIAALIAAARIAQADSWLLTEKDLVKLTPPMRASLEQIGPLLAPELRVTLLHPAQALPQLLALISHNHTTPPFHLCHLEAQRRNLLLPPPLSPTHPTNPA